MDNFFARTFRREASQPSTSGAVEEPKRKGGSYRSNVVTVRSKLAALSVPAFCRGVQVIADTMSQCQMQYQKFDRIGGNFVVNMDNKGTAIGQRMNYLVQVRPNPRMSWSQLIKQATHNQYFDGNAYIYIRRDDGGEVQSFWLASSGQYEEMSDTYSITYDNNIRVSNISPSDIIHIRAEYGRDGKGYSGMSVLEYAKSALSIAATNDKQTLDNAAKGGKQKLLLQEDKSQNMGVGRAAKKELEKVTEQLNDDLYSKDVVQVSNVATVTPISQTAQSMEISSIRSFQIREIARILGIPPVMLMDDSNSSYKSPEAAMQAFLMYCISPLVKQWEDEFNAKIVGPEGFGLLRFHLCTDPLMRLDPAGRANIGKTLLETGVKSVNELRQDYDLPTVKEGDVHYISTNLAEVGSEKLRGNSSNSEEGGQA